MKHFIQFFKSVLYFSAEMINQVINPKMILLARESRGLTQQSLAERINTNKAQLSRMENGEVSLSGDMLLSMAEATSYPAHFFFQKGDVVPVNLAYRKRQHVPAKIIAPIEAQVNIMRMHAEILLDILKIPLPALPVHQVTEEKNPAAIAALTRSAWNVKTPVIDNLIQLLEEKGLLINLFDFGTERVDSKSILTGSRFPLIFLNASLLGDRQRFSLAYELGHLIMHTFTVVPHNRNVAHEANEFAAEFLMPADEIRKDFEKGVSLPLLGELKRKWKASMISLLYRADDLGFLSPSQKRYLIQQFNQLRIRRREPAELDIPVEKPILVSKLIADCRKKLNLHITGMATLLSMQESEYLELYGEDQPT
ncbi:MAG: ImmA/IrrE family metallo-endopeptidase [Chitinophagaceae bacterium]|nr:ImmA/IrrE family metallo-endopeptidase [Chitinophagaceae bacterium]